MMPIDTRLDGNPATLYAGSQYLRGRLGFEVDGAGGTLRAVGDEARHGWLGSAGAAFSARMTAAAGRADALRAEIDATAATFSQYADMLASAQTTMLVARQIATSGGLIVAGTMILDPYSPDPVTHQQQRLTYALAVQQVSQARALMATARAVAQARQSAARAQPMIQPGDVVGGTATVSRGGAPKPAAEPNTEAPRGGAPKPAAEPNADVPGGAPKPAEDGALRSGEIAFAPEQRQEGLLAHELTHVLQQAGFQTSPPGT